MHTHIQLQCNTKQHTFPPAAAISVYLACTERQHRTDTHTHTAAMQHKTAHLPPSSCHQCIPGLYGTPTQDRHTNTYSCNATQNSTPSPQQLPSMVYPCLCRRLTQHSHTRTHAYTQLQKTHAPAPPAAAINGIPTPVQKANAVQPHTHIHTRIHTAVKHTHLPPQQLPSMVYPRLRGRLVQCSHTRTYTHIHTRIHTAAKHSAPAPPAAAINGIPAPVRKANAVQPAPPPRFPPTGTCTV